VSVTERLAVPENAGAGWLRPALALAKGPRTLRAARALTVGLAVYEVGKKAYDKGRGRITYTVSVPAADEVYDAISDWLTDQVPARSRRALTIRTRRRASSYDDQPIEPEGSSRQTDPPDMRALYDGTVAQNVRIAGHRVSVKINQKSLGEGLTLSVNTHGDSWSRAMKSVEFTCYGERSRDAVLAFLTQLAAERLAGSEVRPRMWIATRWGEWRRVREVPLRSLDTVILPADQRERIVADLAGFLAAEGLYSRVGIPWHHGLLFHGPPGCGKTSLATALAGHFGLDVHLLPLSDLEADAHLMGLLANVDARSVLILEDIDVVHAATTRDDDRKGVTLSGLLNALDGIATPHGLVTVMTTNDLASLDPALVRPGRADLVEEFGPLDGDQAQRLGDLVTGSTNRYPLPALNGAHLTHAELLDAAKPHLDDPVAAHRALSARILRAPVGEDAR